MAGNNNEHGQHMPLVDEFENSFQACLAALTNPSSNHIHDSDEIKTSVDQTIQRFLDSAKQMECFFLQKRLYLSTHKPEQLIVEDICDLKTEIARKDQVLQKYHEKISVWQSILSDTPPSGPAGPGPGIPTQQGAPSSNMQPPGPGGMALRGPGPAMMTGPQVGPQIRQPGHGPGGGPPQQQQIPGHHVMQGQIGPQSHMMQQGGHPGQMPPSGMMGHNPQQPGPGMQPGQMQGHGPYMGNPQGQPPPGSNLQGPLAFLERTTSNIGMR